jgi:hypothetical protein
MNAFTIHDPRANDLLSRVSEDVSLLRQDIGNLVSHTTRHTIPTVGRDLADTARHGIAAGKTFTAAQIQALRRQVSQPATAWVGGAVLVGLLAGGVYLLTRNNGCCEEADENI